MGKLLEIPGSAWIALTVLLSAWLQDYFPNELWLAGALGVLALIAKGIDVFYPKPVPSDTERMMTAQPDTFGRKVLRVFLG